MWTAIYGRGNDYVLAREVIRIDIRSELGLGAVAVGQQFFLVVKELFTCLGSEFHRLRLDNRIDGAGLLAHAAVDAVSYTHLTLTTICSV